MKKNYIREGSRDWIAFKKIRKLYDSDSIHKKTNLISRLTNVNLRHIRSLTYAPHFLKGNIENPIGAIQIPLGIAGPVKVKGRHANGDFLIPMATTEGALVLTYDHGMRILRTGDPIMTEVLSKVIHITPMFPIKNGNHVLLSKFVGRNLKRIKRVAEADSRHTKLLRIEKIKVANNFLLKFIYDTGDAHGLNMINHATFNACKFIETETGNFFYLRSHYSGVKHHSLLNEMDGYGRAVKASVVIPTRTFDIMGVTAKQIKDFCDRCLKCGTAAKINSVNVHAANAIAAIFLACGQDAADISSSHVCQSRCELSRNGKELYWECVLRNLLIATVGGGTGLGTQSECLKIMDCYGSGKSDRLAELIAATVLAGEFPTAAAVVNRTYVSIHDKYGRNKKKHVK